VTFVLQDEDKLLLRETLRESIENNEVAGASVLLLEKGQEVVYLEDGMADRENGLPIRRDTIFRLYSMSKPVTGAAVLMLMERGKLDLYDPVSRYLPGFKHQLVEDNGRILQVQREMTIHDLLSMTSGLVYGGAHAAGRETEALFREIDRRLLTDDPMSTTEAVNRMGGCKLASQPGSMWHYGTSADVLGAVVEAASGSRFGDFLRQEMFEPLGMTDTGFWVPEDKRPRLAKTYQDDGQGGLTLYTGNNLGIINAMDRDPAFESGGAGLVSTIDDYAKFATMLLNGGKHGGGAILKPATVRYFASPSLNDEQQKGFERTFATMRGYNYANLTRIMTHSGQAAMLTGQGEYGWDGWLGAFFSNLPAEGLTFLLMMQKKDAGTTRLTRKLRNIILGSY
jgi:CubicO group peptidase (beta-lactamase class C family)